MKNWAKNIVFNPAEIAYPNSEEAIQQLVLKAANSRKKIRMIGTGHSFTPLIKTTDILVSLDKYQGLISVDKKKVQATVKAGTKLKLLGELLFQEGMAMENLGDIDVQSIAGTICTGTHGTGKQFGTISTQVIGLKFVNGKGEIVNCSSTEHPELFKAAQVSLGVLGVITEVTLQCLPAYKLALQNKKESLDTVLSSLADRNEQNRNFEFLWIPYTDTVFTKTTNIAEEDEPDKINFFNYWSEYMMENMAFKALSEFVYYFPSKTVAMNNFITNAATEVSKVYYSHKIYATQRLVRFKEMEYNIPAEAHEAVFREIQKAFTTKKINVSFPIENRWVKGDDILMSPAYQRDSAYFAVHVYNKKDHNPYFAEMEAIFRSHGGRPHWGKMNTLTANDVADLYPELPTFLKHRAAQDPDNIFITPYMQQLLGV